METTRYRLTRDGLTYRVALAHWLPRRVTRHDATTLGRTIYVADARLDPGLHAHEFTHVEQFAAAPWTFYVRYCWQALRGYPAPPRYTNGNAFEVAAYARELDPRQVATFGAVP